MTAEETEAIQRTIADVTENFKPHTEEQDADRRAEIEQAQLELKVTEAVYENIRARAERKTAEDIFALIAEPVVNVAPLESRYLTADEILHKIAVKYLGISSL